MNIEIKTPTQLKTERTKLLAEAVRIMRQQQRALLRYSAKINAIHNRVERIEKLLGETL